MRVMLTVIGYMLGIAALIALGMVFTCIAFGVLIARRWL
jgi:hypothetical protein